MKAEKTLLLTMAVLALVLVVVALYGCGEDATETMAGGTENTTTTAPETTTKSASQEGTVTDVLPEEAKKLIDAIPDLVIIELGNPSDQGHIPGAINMTPDELSDAISASTLDPGVPHLVYANEEINLGGWAGVLVRAGFTVYVMGADISGWIDSGYPVER